MPLIVPNISRTQDKIMCIHQSWNQTVCDSGQVLRSLIKEGFLLRFFSHSLNSNKHIRILLPLNSGTETVTVVSVH